jgi:hypothetical protein
MITGVGTRVIVGESRWFGLVGGCKMEGKSDGAGKGMYHWKRRSGVSVRPFCRFLMFWSC